MLVLIVEASPLTNAMGLIKITFRIRFLNEWDFQSLRINEFPSSSLGLIIITLYLPFSISSTKVSILIFGKPESIFTLYKSSFRVSASTATTVIPTSFRLSTFCLPRRFKGVTMIVSLSCPSSRAIRRGIQKVSVFLKPVAAHTMTSFPPYNPSAACTWSWQGRLLNNLETSCLMSSTVHFQCNIGSSMGGESSALIGCTNVMLTTTSLQPHMEMM